MNPIDSCLQRLFRAARPPEDTLVHPPFWFETRVLADWRHSIADNRLVFLPLVRGACVCACAIILISMAVTLRSWTEPPPNELVIVDSVIQLSLMQ